MTEGPSNSFTDTATVEDNLQARLAAAQTQEEREYWQRQIDMHSVVINYEGKTTTSDDTPSRGGRETIRLDPVELDDGE
jgi:hypothetical protein